MFSTIEDMFNKIKDAILTLWDQLVLLPDRIDSITFSDNTAITSFLALIHYVLGTPLYALFCLGVLIGSGFILYHIAKTILALISNFIPGLKGKFILP